MRMARSAGKQKRSFNAQIDSDLFADSSANQVPAGRAAKRRATKSVAIGASSVFILGNGEHDRSIRRGRLGYVIVFGKAESRHVLRGNA
jgi:hypothetical protein